METVRLTRQDLPADMPLIGFSGAPFTLASYMIEGGSSRNYAAAKAMMHGDPGAWNQLMEHLVQSISIYLNGQIEAEPNAFNYLIRGPAACPSMTTAPTSIPTFRKSSPASHQTCP